MNETNKFYDYGDDSIQAALNSVGLIELDVYGIPELMPDQAIEFAKQLTELAQEAKAKQ